MWVRPENEKLQYSGRIDHSSKSAPVFVYPCTSVRVRFTGEGIKVWLRNRHQYWDNYMGYIADGKQGKFRLEEDTTPDERTEGSDLRYCV